MNRYRLFLAIEIPVPLQKYLAKRVAALRLAHVNLRPLQHYHVTLKFFGLVSEEELPALIRTIEESLMQAQPLSLGIDGPGIFPHKNRARILMLGLTGDIDRLIKLAHAADVWGSKEIRDFAAHITIGTVEKSAKLSQRVAIANTFLKLVFKKPTWFTASEIVLLRSKLTKGNPVYSKIASFSLQ